MSFLRDLSLRVTKYKCFGAAPVGFDEILPMNIIIGRNNSGKSALLDLLQHVVAGRGNGIAESGHNNSNDGVIHFSAKISESQLREVFSDQLANGPHIKGNHWEFGKQWVGAKVRWTLNSNNEQHFVEIEPPFNRNIGEFKTTLAKVLGNPFLKRRLIRIAAERNIVPEPDSNVISVQSDGKGATNAIHHFLHKSQLRGSDLVEKALLGDLNKIADPDSPFTRIVTQHNPDGCWEVYLDQANKTRVPLHDTGSGFKTVLLVLVFLILIPQINGEPFNENYLYAFEELENNLHPAMQRRLLLYLRGVASRSNCTFFLTTHSNVAIDFFSSDANAQIIHMVHDGTSAHAHRVKTFIQHKDALDDLGVRASDLLQSNCVIWVEGPSDRLYINKWIELLSKGFLKEGLHYQCVFYGGRLLAHLSASDIALEDAVRILAVNRNAVLVVDRDRDSSDKAINATKERIISEIRDNGGVAWLTDGREIENYLHPRLLSEMFPNAINKLGRFESISDWIEKSDAGNGRRFLKDKVGYAATFCSSLIESDLDCGDLRQKVDTVCAQIRKWNGEYE